MNKMNAIEFLKSQFTDEQRQNHKPEEVEAMAAFMETYAREQLKKEKELFRVEIMRSSNRHKIQEHQIKTDGQAREKELEKMIERAKNAEHIDDAIMILNGN